MNGSSLELPYRAPLCIYIFYIFWYLFLTLVAAALTGNAWAPEITSAGKQMVVGSVGLLLVGPIAMHAIGTRRSDDELSNILDFVSHHIEATR